MCKYLFRSLLESCNHLNGYRKRFTETETGTTCLITRLTELHPCYFIMVLQLFEKEIAQEQEELRNEREARGAIRRITKRDVHVLLECSLRSNGSRINRISLEKQCQKKNFRQRFNPRYEAVEAHCRCVGNIDMECIRFETPPNDETAKCVCTYDREMMVAWPCFNSSVWFDHVCPSCKEDGYCEYALKESEVIPEGLTGWSCKCRNRTSDSLLHAPYCIGKQPVEIRKLWVDDLNKTVSMTTITTPTKPTSGRPNQRAIVSNPETIKAMDFRE
ncbi:hypothetical protein KIN20_008112 [Parelaphostrongylus tenuis]|uniref:Uncharacterized protein n=1 Tax=Parelaphostrongylus tenuis TaxID=148309 RepID=A0AAD5M939_PARTN|nr:hypothetical protein KIN20_008112 [Parelaphostrongylus tenuis]